MNPFEAYGSPSEDRPASRFRDDEPYERGDNYRRRSPGKSSSFPHILNAKADIGANHDSLQTAEDPHLENAPDLPLLSTAINLAVIEPLTGVHARETASMIPLDLNQESAKNEDERLPPPLLTLIDMFLVKNLRNLLYASIP